MNVRKLRWGCIQPLTGGMYIGGRNVIGHDAEWIISYKGLNDTKTDKDENIISAGNEYNLMKWLEKNNSNVPYYTFEHGMFENPRIEDVKISKVNCEDTPSFENIDIVLAVPVCSGLSQATIAGKDTKDTRNCNMEFITNYVLNVVKPKVYIFENAPALFTGSGQEVRNILNEYANNYGYSVVYYRTDTQLHDNCQRRPRTFVIFSKTDYAPVLGFENKPANIVEYFNRIPKDASQQVSVNMGLDNKVLYEFVKYYYGKDWRTKAEHWTINNLVYNNLWDEYAKFVDKFAVSQDIKDKIHKYCNHVQDKLAQGKNFFAMVPLITDENTILPAVMFRTIPTVIHFKEDRLYTIREWLWSMGMPHDYILYGDINQNYAKIGQNVPVRTAQWIVSEALRIINDSIETYADTKCIFIDNTKQKIKTETI